MGQAIALREDFSAHDLKRIARMSNDANQVRRLLALVAVMEGASRGDAASLANADVQTLRDWVLRYNGEGPEGLVDRKRSGRKRKLALEERNELAAIVLLKPGQERDGLVRWRLCDLQDVVKKRFGTAVCENTVSRYLKEENLSWITGRPLHPLQEPGVIETFKKSSPTRLPRL